MGQEVVHTDVRVSAMDRQSFYEPPELPTEVPEDGRLESTDADAAAGFEQYAMDQQEVDRAQ